MSKLFTEMPVLKKKEDEKSSAKGDTEEARKRPFYINYQRRELVLPTPHSEDRPLYVMTLALITKLWNLDESNIGTIDSDMPTGLADDVIKNFSQVMIEAFDILEVGNVNYKPTASLLAKIFTDQALKQYRSRFVNLGRNEKMLNHASFKEHIKASPIMKGKENTRSFKYVLLIESIISRICKFNIGENVEGPEPFTDHLSNGFFKAYLKSDVVKETFKDALKENRVKLIDLNSFNSILLEGESNHLDLVGAGENQPGQDFAKEYAKISKAYDGGDLRPCLRIHEWSKDLNDKLGPSVLGVLFRRLKARNRVASTKEVDAIARREKVNKFAYSLDKYLPYMNKEELDLFKPGMLFPVLEDVVDDLKAANKYRVHFKVKYLGKGSNIKSYELDVPGYLKMFREQLRSRYYYTDKYVREKHPDYSDKEILEFIERGKVLMSEAFSRAESCVPLFESDANYIITVLPDWNL